MARRNAAPGIGSFRYQVTTVKRRETATRPSSAPTARAPGWEARPQSYKTVAPTKHVRYAAVSSKRDIRARRRQSATTGAGSRERTPLQRRLTDRASAAVRRVVVDEHNYCLIVDVRALRAIVGGGMCRTVGRST